MQRTKIIAIGLAALMLIQVGCARKTRLGGLSRRFPATFVPAVVQGFRPGKGHLPQLHGKRQRRWEQKIIQGTVDFAGYSDAPNPENLEKKIDSKGIVFPPMTAGAIVLTYNLEGVEKLKLSQKALVGIYLGTITKWIRSRDTKATIPTSRSS